MEQAQEFCKQRNWREDEGKPFPPCILKVFNALCIEFVHQLERSNPSSAAKRVSLSPAANHSFHNLSNPQNLEKFNSHLQLHSYVEGYSASYGDLVVHSTVPKAVLSSYPHIKRWYFHISAIADSIQVPL